MHFLINIYANYARVSDQKRGISHAMVLRANVQGKMLGSYPRHGRRVRGIGGMDPDGTPQSLRWGTAHAYIPPIFRKHVTQSL